MSTPTYTINPGGSSITCNLCGRTSYHALDVKNRYCGACHVFHEDPASVLHHRAQLHQVMVQKPSTRLFIDLAGLDDKWSTRGRQVCAVCGFDFDREDECGEPDQDLVPLLLWRNEGREMLTLCWACAAIRMQRKEKQHEH